STVSVSVWVATLSLRSTVVVAPTLTETPSRFVEAKPDISTVREYRPTGRPWRVNVPVVSVVVERCRPVALSRADTAAPGTPSPCSSTTLPDNDPDVPWATASPAVPRTAAMNAMANVRSDFTAPPHLRFLCARRGERAPHPPGPGTRYERPRTGCVLDCKAGARRAGGASTLISNNLVLPPGRWAAALDSASWR